VSCEVYKVFHAREHHEPHILYGSIHSVLLCEKGNFMPVSRNIANNTVLPKRLIDS
jgi:hypothetical protein